jgi:hypothetical protein
VQFYDLKNGAKIGIKKRGNGGKEKFVHFLTLKVELHLPAKKVKVQALNFWRLNFFK